jgi:hypothetical protein
VKNPLNSVKKSRAVKAVAKSKPVKAIKDAHPIDSIKKSKAAKAVARSKPVKAIKDAHPIDSIKTSKAANAVARSRPVKAITGSRPAKAIARTVSDARDRVAKMSLDTGDGPLGKRSRKQLYNRARELGVRGRSRMSKSQLITAIRRTN